MQLASMLTDYQMEVGGNWCFVSAEHYFKCCLYQEAKPSVRPEEQIANVLVLLKGPPPRAAPLLRAGCPSTLQSLRLGCVSRQASAPEFAQLE